MLALSDIREIFAYDIYTDRSVIRHDVGVSTEQFNCMYRVPYKKFKNPLTLERYRNRSMRLLWGKIAERGLSRDDLRALRMP